MGIRRELIRDLGESLNKLNTTFFTDENINAIQMSLIQNVKNFSEEHFEIGNQSVQELGIIMREVYKNYSIYPGVDTDQNIITEIQRLDNIIVEKATIFIIKKIRVQQKYLQDKYRGSYNLETRPEPVNTRGTRLSHSRFDDNLGVHKIEKIDLDKLPW